MSNILSPQEISALKRKAREGQSTYPINYDAIIARAQIDKLIDLGWESPEDVLTKLNTAIFSWLDIEHPCTACGGRGRRSYPNTATWIGGIAGQMVTTDICDKCWGSGDADRHWTNLRVLRYILTPEQVKKYRENTK